MELPRGRIRRDTGEPDVPFTGSVSFAVEVAVETGVAVDVEGDTKDELDIEDVGEGASD